MAVYLDALRTAEGAAELAIREHALLELAPGQRVLDLGCGPGDDARAFAAAVRPGGSVVAIDRDPAMLRLAAERAATAALQVEFVPADAHDIPLQEGSVDRSFSSRLLHHSSAPERVVAEMVRVTRPGGRVVFSMEPDWDTLVVDAPDRELTRRIVSQRSDSFANGWSGRRLFGLAIGAGLVGVGVRAHTHLITSFDWHGQSLPMPWESQLETMCTRGLINAEEMQAWLGEIRAADAAGRFFAAVTFFSVWGDRRR
jgi:SAM-dependent methyltransferase